MKNTFLITLANILMQVSASSFAATVKDYTQIPGIDRAPVVETAPTLKIEDESVSAVYRLLKDMADGNADMEGFFTQEFINPSQKARTILSLYMVKLGLLSYRGGIFLGNELNEHYESKVPLAVVSASSLAMIYYGSRIAYMSQDFANDNRISALEKAGKYIKKSTYLKEVLRLEEIKVRLQHEIFLSDSNDRVAREWVLAKERSFADKRKVISTYQSYDKALAKRLDILKEVEQLDAEVLKNKESALAASLEGRTSLADFRYEVLEKVQRKLRIVEASLKGITNKLTELRLDIKELPKGFQERSNVNFAKLKERIQKELWQVETKIKSRKSQKARISALRSQRIQRLFKTQLRLDKLEKQTKKVLFIGPKIFMKSHLHTARVLTSGLALSVIPLAAIEGLIFTFGEVQNFTFELNAVDRKKTLAGLDEKIRNINHELKSLIYNDLK